MEQTIALVGHCGIDGPRLKAELSRQFPQTQVLTCNDTQALEELCNDKCLLLFNRELVGEFDVDQGVDLIRKVKQSHPDARVMLISDYDDAQEDAKSAGAVRGFGKADLGSRKPVEVIRGAMPELH